MSSKQEKRIIEVMPYDSSWPITFLKESEVIKKALGDNCIEIHHIGSTAVLGLAAKPVIDMVPVVLDITQVDSSNASMRALGYEAEGEYGMPFRRYFQKGGNCRTHQAHVFEIGNPEIEHHLKFRDWMRTHTEDRDAYAHLKQDLARQHPHDINAYCLGKDSFIATIDKKTGFSGLRMVQALTTREWDAVHYLRQLYFFDKAGLSDSYAWTFKEKHHIHFVLYQGIEIIGYAHLQLCPEEQAVIRMIVIDERKRNQHYGSKFLALCERWLRSQGYKNLHTVSSPDALQFYKYNAYIDMPFYDADGYESSPQDVPLGKLL